MTTWSSIAKPVITTTVGTPIGLLLALTQNVSSTANPWTSITKPSGTAWSSLTKPSGTSWTTITKAS